MILGKKRALGKEWEELQPGQKAEAVREVRDRDILMYLGVTDDTNPVYLQSGYAEQTEYERVIVPSGLLMGWIASLISGELPGPGSVIREQRMAFPEVLHPGSRVHLALELIHKAEREQLVTLAVSARDETGRRVAEGEVDVVPPLPMRSLWRHAFENF